MEKFIRYGELFQEYTGYRLYLYIAISALVTLVESVGIGLFFPLINGLQENDQLRSPLEKFLAETFLFFGLEYRLETILLAMIVVFLAKAVLQFGAGVYQSKIITWFLAEISKRTHRAISGQDYQHFLVRNIGTLVNVTVNETNRAMVALVKFATLFPSLIAISVFSVLAFRLDWRLTLGALLFGACVLGVTRYVSRLARVYSYRNTEIFGVLSGLVLQSFGSFKYLKSTMGMGALRKQIDRMIDRLCHTQLMLSISSHFSQAINEPVVVVFLVAMFWHQTIIEKQPLGQVVVLGLFFFRLIKEVMLFQASWHGFSTTLGSIDAVAGLVADAERFQETFRGTAFTKMENEICFENVSFSYGSRLVLKDISLAIKRNSMVAFVGESGSGKSTLVDLITGLLKPTAGKILADGVRYSDLDLSSFRERVGFVTQEPAIFNDTISNNISFWDHGDKSSIDSRVFAAAEAANCEDFISRLDLGFDTVLGDRGVNLSGGQRQRIAIARELYKKPDLLILDEATSALDGEAELEIQKSIEKLKGKLTTLVIAHRLSTIRNADLIFVFSDGNLVEEGTFEELYMQKNSFFRRFCELQGLSSEGRK